jgi:hypothetical protein
MGVLPKFQKKLLPLTSRSSSLRAGLLDTEDEGGTIFGNVRKYTHNQQNVLFQSNRISNKCLLAKIQFLLFRNNLCSHFFWEHFR